MMLSANAPLIPVQHLLHLAAAQRSHGSRFTVRFGTVLFFLTFSEPGFQKAHAQAETL